MKILIHKKFFFFWVRPISFFPDFLVVSFCKWWSTWSWILACSKHLLRQLFPFLSERNYCDLKTFESRLLITHKWSLDLRREPRGTFLGSWWRRSCVRVCPVASRQGRHLQGQVNSYVDNFILGSCLCFLPCGNKLCVSSCVTDVLWWVNWGHLPLPLENITAGSTYPWSQKQKGA